MYAKQVIRNTVFVTSRQPIVQPVPKKQLQNSWISRSSLNSQEKVSSPRPTPIHKLSMTSTVWNISTSQLGLAAWLCCLPTPAHLLIS